MGTSSQRENNGATSDRSELTIDLTEIRGAAPLRLEQQLFQHEMNRAIRLVEEFIDLADEREQRTNDMLRREPWADPPLLHEGLLVSGPRGSGKTTFVLSLNQAIQKRHRHSVAVLPPLDPTLVDGDELFIASVIGNILRRVEPGWRNADRNRAKALETTLQALSDGLLASHRETWTHHLSQSASPSVFAEQIVGFARGGLQLRRLFAEFVSAAASLIEVKAFLQPIDDVDMAGADAWTVLETVRRYLTGPRILPIVTGHLPQFRAMVLEVKLGDIKRRRSIPEQHGTEAEEALEEVRQLANQHLLKLIRPERRMLLTSARVQLKQRGRVVIRYPDAGETPPTLEGLMRPVVEYTAPTPDSFTDPFAAIPENARLMRAVLAWAAEAVGADHNKTDHTPQRLNDANTWVRLLEVDGEAQEHQRWSADQLLTVIGGDYRPLLQWALNPLREGRLEFSQGFSGNTPWALQFIDRSLAGALRARNTGELSVYRSLSYFFEVTLPVALFHDKTRGETKDRTKLLDDSDSPASQEIFLRVAGRAPRHAALELAGYRWNIGTRAVLNGLARAARTLNIKSARSEPRNPVLERVYRRAKKPPTEQGHRLWIRWLFAQSGQDDTPLNKDEANPLEGSEDGTPFDSDRTRIHRLRNWETICAPGRKPKAAWCDQLCLTFDQLERILAGPRSIVRSSATVEAVDAAQHHWPMVRLFRSLYHSRVSVRFGDSMLVDPLAGIASVVELCGLKLPDSTAAPDEAQKEVAKALQAQQYFAENRHSPSALDPNNAQESSDGEDDTEVDESSTNASVALPGEFLTGVTHWVETVTALDGSSIRPAALGTLARTVTDLQHHLAKDLNSQSASVGDVLNTHLLAILNAVLFAELGSTMPLEPGTARSHWTTVSEAKPNDSKANSIFRTMFAKTVPAGAFLRNLDKATAADHSEDGTPAASNMGGRGPSQALKEAAPMFWALASCPLVLGAIAPAWRRVLIEKLNIPPADWQKALVVELPSAIQTTKSNDPRRERVDLAVLLHAVAIGPPQDGRKQSDKLPWQGDTKSELSAFLHTAHLYTTRGKNEADKLLKSSTIVSPSEPSPDDAT